MNITAGMVKQLRDQTGAGMMDCKAALTETGGEMEAAVDWLRTKGLAKAAKKAGRVAAEGLIAVVGQANRAVMIELNSETDFVARNPDFQALALGIAETAVTTDGTLDVDPGRRNEVDGHQRRRCDHVGDRDHWREHFAPPCRIVAVDHGVVASYVHGAVAPGLGKIGVIVGLESKGKAESLEQVGKQVAMHIAAASPLAVRPGELDPEIVARERSIFAEQARSPASPRRSSRRWSRAACASSTRRSCCSRRPSSSTARRPSSRR